LMRVEQLYPFPLEQLADTLREVPDGTPTFWVQEEPENMGAWRTVRVLVGERLLHRLPFSGIYRPESASPATGSLASHRYEQGRLLSEALEAER
ncbi:MAG TPA: hypothetical protein VK116_20400, partial [Planctomycetota bacterium]|nr:hypothetical protein [Planctomycetota bacterium]